MKILMVCLGNICRSPMAEGILRYKADEAGIDVDIDSSGTSGWHIGEQPDRRASHTLMTKGIDIRGLRARQFHRNDFEEFDLIYAMDESNFDDIMEMANSSYQQQKVRMILNESHPGKNLPVPDPYYGGDQGFEHVFKLLDEACEVIIQDLSK